MESNRGSCPGAGTGLLCGGEQLCPLTTRRLPSQSGTRTSLRIDERRVSLLDRLYVVDGRECPKHPRHGTYTGLWQDFAHRLAQRFCDAEYEEVVAQCAQRIKETQSCLVEQHAAAAVEALRDYMLSPWE